MTPLKIFLSLKDWLAAEESLIDIKADDPLLHPDIRAMTVRQVADLPFPRRPFPDEKHENPPLARCA